jgi:hypothetical protein
LNGFDGKLTQGRPFIFRIKLFICERGDLIPAGAANAGGIGNGRLFNAALPGADRDYPTKTDQIR